MAVDTGTLREVLAGQGFRRLMAVRLSGQFADGLFTAALFSAHLLETGAPAVALARTASSVFDLLVNTLDAGTGELQLVESQTAYAEPRMQFEVQRLR